MNSEVTITNNVRLVLKSISIVQFRNVQVKLITLVRLGRSILLIVIFRNDAKAQKNNPHSAIYWVKR